MPQFIRIQSNTVINADQISAVERVIYNGRVYIAVRMIGDPARMPLSSAFSYDDPEIAEKEFLSIVSKLVGYVAK